MNFYLNSKLRRTLQAEDGLLHETATDRGEHFITCCRPALVQAAEASQPESSDQIPTGDGEQETILSGLVFTWSATHDSWISHRPLGSLYLHPCCRADAELWCRAYQQAEQESAGLPPTPAHHVLGLPTSNTFLLVTSDHGLARIVWHTMPGQRLYAAAVAQAMEGDALTNLTRLIHHVHIMLTMRRMAGSRARDGGS